MHWYVTIQCDEKDDGDKIASIFIEYRLWPSTNLDALGKQVNNPKKGHLLTWGYTPAIHNTMGLLIFG